MSFLSVFALSIGLLVAIPLVAHLLRRGRVREQAFVPIELVRVARASARQKSRLDDRLVFSLRALMILTLALLGAVPFVRCSHLSLAREAGASVAIALVVDDSLSMQARAASGPSRFEQARRAAQQLMVSSRPGDAVAIILAGYPARIALGATTDLAAARSMLDALEVGDRRTDLGQAVELARSTIRHLPHVDKRVVVLSDLADAPLKPGEPGIWLPLRDIQTKPSNCGIALAEKQGSLASLRVACSTAEAAAGRRAFVVAAADGHSEPSADAESLGEAPLSAQAGAQTVSVRLAHEGTHLWAKLSGKDDIKRDDLAALSSQSGALTVGLLADRGRGGVVTGGTTVLEQGLSALELEVSVKPLTILKESAEDLASYDALILDDPAGISPEARRALTEWVSRGRTAVALLGPLARTAQLGSNLEPFLWGAIDWQSPTTATGLANDTVTWAFGEQSGLEELVPRGRITLSAGMKPEARVLARWQDNEPFAVEQPLGRGVVVSIGLPSSVEHSDFALRPGFLGLLDALLTEAKQRSGVRRSEVGTPWAFPLDANVSVLGPTGPLLGQTTAATEADAGARLTFDPARRGRYQLTVDGSREERVAFISQAELLAAPEQPEAKAEFAHQAKADPKMEISREVALALLLLFAAEVAFRLVRWVRGLRVATSG